MANLVQKVGLTAGWLIAALAFSQTTSTGAFSHRIHLAQNIDCLVCHSSAAASSKASDNLLPTAAVCNGCHTGARQLRSAAAIKTPRQSLVTKFNHAGHTQMGNIAALLTRAIDAKIYLSDGGDLRKQLEGAHGPCTGCHRELSSSDAVTAAAFPRMADCLVCHNKVDPPFSCTKCHDDGAHLKPASHVAGFLDRHSSGKANLEKASCAVCHGRRFTCLGCHQ